MRELLQSARFEIAQLRRENEILSARVSTMEVFAAALGLKGSPQTMMVDILWQIDRELEKDSKLNQGV